MSNKFTIEISKEALDLINVLKKDEQTVESVLADMVDIGLQEIGRARVDAIREAVKGTPMGAMIESMEEMLAQAKNETTMNNLPEDHPLRMMREAMGGVPVVGIRVSKEGGIEGLEDVPPPIRQAIEKMRPAIMEALNNDGDVREVLQKGLEGFAGVANAKDLFGDTCDCENCTARRESEVHITPLSTTKS